MQAKASSKLTLAIVSLVAAAGVFLIAPTLASAAGFSDSVFKPINWSDSILFSRPNVTVAMSQVGPNAPDCDGDGFYQQGTHTLSGAFAALYDGHTYVGAPAYDPATQGAIASLDVSYCLKNFLPISIQDGLLIEQGFRRFIYFVDSVGPYSSWTHLQATNITAVPGPMWTELGPSSTIINGTTPDFSATGLPIRCGYYTFNGLFSVTATWGIDDWSCTIHKVAIKVQPKPFKTAEGATFIGPVATFTDAPASPAYTATIDWGDTHSSTGTISGPPGGPFTVKGMNTYAEEGNYTVKVTVTQTGNPTNTGFVTYNVHVATIPITVNCATPATSPMNFNHDVVTFTHNNNFEPLGLAEYGVTINWGDGSPASPPSLIGGSISGGGTSTVTGSHNYLSDGPQTIAVRVTDDNERATKRCHIRITAKRSGTFTVDSANHDIWLAGMPNFTVDNGGFDVAPNQSPFLAGGPLPVAVIPGQYLEFLNVAGTVTFHHDDSSDCDGNTAFPNFVHNGGATPWGIAGLTAPANSLIGVFIGSSQPSGVPPATLDFGDATGSIPSGIPVGGGPLLLGAASRTFTTLSPKLQQPFFIGDGVDNTTNTTQQFFIPPLATRLYLGTMDQQKWSDNTGQCKIGDVLTSDP